MATYFIVNVSRQRVWSHPGRGKWNRSPTHTYATKKHGYPEKAVAEELAAELRWSNPGEVISVVDRPGLYRALGVMPTPAASPARPTGTGTPLPFGLEPILF